MNKPGYVYILASGFKHLYIGVTSNLERRLGQHKSGTYAAAFTERYNIKRFVYFERFASMPTAIAREKQLKRWSRIKKIRFVVATNPDWQDLSLAWGTPIEPFAEVLRSQASTAQSSAPPAPQTTAAAATEFASAAPPARGSATSLAGSGPACAH